MKLRILGLILFLGLGFWGQSRMHGFRLAHLACELPQAWENTQMSEEIHRRLDQPFRFFGKGGWCYAFLGKDQKTVLKFFRKDAGLQLPFNSLTLLFQKAKDRSGLLYLHLHETNNALGFAEITDPSGVVHRVNLDKMGFALQEKGELIFSWIEQKMAADDLEGAKKAIDSFLECIVSLHRQGIKDIDRSFTNNFGFIGDRAFTLDISSFVYDAKLSYKKETIRKTSPLSRWLNKHHPQLHAYFEEKLDQIIDST